MPFSIALNPSCNIYYAGYYIYGLEQCCELGGVRFEAKPFADLRTSGNVLALVVRFENANVRVVIDYDDWWGVDEKAYDWCEVYAKINLALDYEGPIDKMLIIGPGFGIKIYGALRALWHMMSNAFMSGSGAQATRRQMALYYSQMLRPSIFNYEETSCSEKDFLYLMASLWRRWPEANEMRRNYIIAANNTKGIFFEGGFAPRSDGDINGYEEYTLHSRHSSRKYLDSVKRSMCVFNTPAVGNCHGWKLAEYCGLGKAIISTQLMRTLPAPMMDGEHILYTDGTPKDISTKICMIRDDESLRKRLELGARRYYDEYLAPTRVAKIILEAASSRIASVPLRQ